MAKFHQILKHHSVLIWRLIINSNVPNLCLGLNASLDEEHVFRQILVETVYNHDDKPEVWAGSAADTIRIFMLLEKLDF